MAKTEFEFERGEILSNLTLLEDHGFKAPCPYCMEKHTSKIIGYAEEIEAGKEGDEAIMKQLAIDMRAARQLENELKKKDIPNAFEKLGEIARVWRRKLQGAENHSHADTIETSEHKVISDNHQVKPCKGSHCGHVHG